ncbi:MAG: 8-amino-7-oxononanoate synthase [Candidatus Omnitrophica bacterium]|nr:8-amino-7-oxononanoate synthase [Candidatus Omnitrophota bacterium]
MKFIDEELKRVKDEGLYRHLRCLEGHQGARIKIDGRECVNLCSNNYLGLASNPRLKQAAIEATQKYGCGSGASRLVCGNFKLYEELEGKIAGFKGQEAALVFNSGYSANLGAITALVGRGDIVFSDKLNHASIVDAVILSRAELRRYPHKDVKALEEMLRVEGQGSRVKKRLIVTDTLFSMDGDIAPLPELAELAKRHDAMLMVDEAHATGVFGEGRSGLAERFGLSEEIDAHMGTLSKAFGSLGGYVAGRKELIEYLVNKSRPFIYTTALPPSVLAAAAAAIDVVRKDNWLNKALWENAGLLKRGLIDLGFDLVSTESQIIPVLIGEADKAVEFADALFEEGIFIQPIRPPTVPRGQARLRITVMATHKKEDLEMALLALEKAGRKLGIIS